MFTGIVEEIGIIEKISPTDIMIQANKVLEDTKLGDSISVNGVCLTVTSLTNKSLSVDIMPETLRRTNIGLLHQGGNVNLERALVVGSRLGGHLIQGHVDATGSIHTLTQQGKAIIVKYMAPLEVTRYVVEKGFIAVDGVSLTAIDCDANSFAVSLVGFTRDHTILGTKRQGDTVNLEADIIAKYVERFQEKQHAKITADFLAEHGFA